MDCVFPAFGMDYKALQSVLWAATGVDNGKLRVRVNMRVRVMMRVKVRLWVML
jgi:hypothetical protein